VFKQANEPGNSPVLKLFELIQAKKNTEESSRDFPDYSVMVKEADIPAGVSLQRRLG